MALLTELNVSVDLSRFHGPGANRLVRIDDDRAIFERVEAAAVLPSGARISLVMETRGEGHRRPAITDVHLSPPEGGALDHGVMKDVAARWLRLTELVEERATAHKNGDGWTWNDDEQKQTPSQVRQKAVTDDLLRMVARVYSDALRSAEKDGKSPKAAKGSAIEAVMGLNYQRTYAFGLVKKARGRGFLPKEGGL